MFRVFTVLIIISPFLFYSCSDKKAEKLTIAVSANAQFAFQTIAEEYRKKENIQIDLISGSSGKLAAQILQGAPYDIFISADTEYPDFVYRKLGKSELPLNYAKGSLVLWSSSLNYEVNKELLMSENIMKIAIANPETAPYGKACLEVLRTLKYYEKLKDKLVFGESISQSAQFIQSGAVQIGFTARSIMFSKAMSEQDNWIDIDTVLHSPITQALLVLNANPVSIKFKDYILSESGQKTLSEFGYFRP